MKLYDIKIKHSGTDKNLSRLYLTFLKDEGHYAEISVYLERGISHENISKQLKTLIEDLERLGNRE